MQYQEEILELDIVGKSIAGIVCSRYYLINDILIVQDKHGESKVIMAASLSGDIILHKIDEEDITQVQVSDNALMFLFHTESGKYLINDSNEIVENSKNWSDWYFENLSNSFYRKDKNGYWYDLEGFRMEELVFLKEDVLVSLLSKKSKRSLSFRGQDLYISVNRQLIQIGKLLFDLNLEIVKYFGDKITGLGSKNIQFEGHDVLQEVKLGLNRSVFINEYSHEPFMIDDMKIVGHNSTTMYGHKRVEVFETESNSYGVIGSSENYIAHNGKPLHIEGDNHIRIGDAVLIKVSTGEDMFYFDLNANAPFSLENDSVTVISHIDPNFISIGNDRLYNVRNSKMQFVIRESDLSIFRINDGQICPQSVEESNKFNGFFGFVKIDGKRKLFSMATLEILKFGFDQLEVSEITSSPHEKFINAFDSNGNKLVLDLRLGISRAVMAVVDGNVVSEIVSAPIRFDSNTLLNVTVEKLRGPVKRVISINSEALKYFSLPENLVQTSADGISSIFAGNPFCEIDYGTEVKIDSRTFISGVFVSYTGKEFPVILDRGSGLPLHLEGNGHRNELASTWITSTINKSFHLGSNRMVCVNTVTENFKEHQLLFSIEKLTSWLPFFDNYLPIMRQVIEIDEKEDQKWNYYLFELGEVSKNKEYLAVEKNAPYRLLTDKKDSTYFPRVIKSKSKSIKSPEELNLLQRIFSLGTGELVEVE